MPKAFPKEFREDVIRVFRESDASVAQVAKDFGISPSCLKRWLTAPVTDAELAQAYRAIALFDAHRDDPEFGYGFLTTPPRRDRPQRVPSPTSTTWR